MSQEIENLKERIAKVETELGVLRVGYEAVFHACEINGLLVGGEPAKVKSSSEKEVLADFGKLPWEGKQGEKGPFEQTSEKACSNSDVWKILKGKLKENKGFWPHEGYRYWFDMKNESVIDRRAVNKT